MLHLCTIKPITFDGHCQFGINGIIKFSIQRSHTKVNFTLKGPFAIDDNDALLSTFFVVNNNKKEWVAWLLLIPFAPDDRK